MTEVAELMKNHHQPNDDQFARWMVKEIGVAAGPGSSFYMNPLNGRTQVRFCFCKKDETLVAAEEKLTRLKNLQHYSSSVLSNHGQSFGGDQEA
jgi:aspartate/methionine/tyrosine aminotransferase